MFSYLIVFLSNSLVYCFWSINFVSINNLVQPIYCIVPVGTYNWEYHFGKSKRSFECLESIGIYCTIVILMSTGVGVLGTVLLGSYSQLLFLKYLLIVSFGLLLVSLEITLLNSIFSDMHLFCLIQSPSSQFFIIQIKISITSTSALFSIHLLYVLLCIVISKELFLLDATVTISLSIY